MLRFYSYATDALLTTLPTFSLQPVQRDYSKLVERPVFVHGVSEYGDGLPTPTQLTIKGGVSRDGAAYDKLCLDRDTILKHAHTGKLWLEIGSTNRRYLIGGITSISDETHDNRDFRVYVLEISFNLLLPIELSSELVTSSHIILANTPTSLSLTNTGNYKTFPKFKLTNLSGVTNVLFTLGLNSFQWSTASALSSSDELIIDSNNGDVLLNGLNGRSLVSDNSSFLQLDAGINNLSVTVVGNQCSLEISYRNAWVM